MNTPLFVSLLHLGDDKKIALNKSKNIKCKQMLVKAALGNGALPVRTSCRL